MNHQMSKADLILALGSKDGKVASRAAELFRQGLAPKILFSGGLGKLTAEVTNIPEAERFAKVAIDEGVPEEAILIENKSTNTGENIQFSFELLKGNNLNPKKIILITKPYMERRAYATFMKQWPENDIEILVTSPQMTFEEYLNYGDTSPEEIINLMVGDLQRIKFYPEKDFQIPQEIPDDIWQAGEELVKLGFDKHSIT